VEAPRGGRATVEAAPGQRGVGQQWPSDGLRWPRAMVEAKSGDAQRQADAGTAGDGA
jgi:hypothetical protein